MRPLPPIILFQAAEGIELQDFVAQVIQVILGIFNVIPHRLPLQSQLVEKRPVQLLVFKV